MDHAAGAMTRTKSKALGVTKVIGSQVNSDRVEHKTENSLWGSRGSVGRIIGTTMIVLLASTSAFGQFLLQPMKIQVQVQPMKRFSTDVALDNLSRNTTETVGLRLVDLTQRPDSVWQDILPEDPNVDRSNLRSCVSWLSLDRDTVEVGPVGRETVKLKIEVPPGMRGYYFAGIIARSAPRTGEVEGYATTTILEYVVPVILEVQGRPMPHQVGLTDVGLGFRQQTATESAATMVTMDISNTGGTYSRLTGHIRVWGQQEGHWRKLTETQLVDIGIIPGVKLHLTRPIDRALGEGRYKVQGFLYVDGQPSRQLEKELDFKGDPRVKNIRSETPLDVMTTDRKADLMIETLPGAVRSQSLTVVNASEETVVVTAELVLPEHMNSARTAGGIPGEEFGCTNWVVVEPRQFTLKGYARQNLRVTARMPNPPGPVPDYYGVIRLLAAYPDGQRSGLAQARVCIHNKNAQGTPRVDKLVFTLNETSPSRYLVVARFANNGNTHVTPRCRAVLTVAGDQTVRDRFNLDSEVAYGRPTMLLPLEVRNFSGVLDIASVPAGTYRLTTILEYDKGGSVQDQMAIDVVEQGGNKQVQVIDIGRVGGKTVINL